MSSHIFQFCDVTLHARPCGALYLPAQETLCVSDLHLGKSQRIARRTGVLVPPYETEETLTKLTREITSTNPRVVICLGDSFDDLAAAGALSEQNINLLTELQKGREWIWIEGNHDPTPTHIPGIYCDSYHTDGLTFRHIAQANTSAEISGHYHPKFGLAGTGPQRPCFAYDHNRLIMPAFGAYTGGLSLRSDVLKAQFQTPLIAVLTGKKSIACPV